MHPQPIYLNGLNGLRAIAALAVVLSHITMSLNAFELDSSIFGITVDGRQRGLDLAGFGVSIFFSLSGFLITYLLLLEKGKQKINVKHFYIRRILRIWPLYYLYFTISLFAILYFGLEFKYSSILFYIFYSANIPFVFGGVMPFLYHFWSLGVEEQFYLFWPWIVKTNNKNLLFVSLSITILLFSMKVAFKYLPFGGDQSLAYIFIHVTRFHCMLIGAMGAILFHQSHSLFIRICTFKLVQLGAWMVIALIMVNRFHIASFIDNELVCIITLIIIIGQITGRNKIVNLEVSLLEFLGKISYGIYVIHPIVIYGFIKILNLLQIQKSSKYAIVYGGILGVTILTSFLSYRYLEKKFLKLKVRFSIIETSDTKDHSNQARRIKDIYEKNTSSLYVAN